ncbi:MAG: hypothetical protein ACYDIA_07650 [Candidatus Humimicrobiaceae bacterium]
MANYLGYIIGAVSSALLFILSGYLEIYCFGPKRRQKEQSENKRHLINYAINELKLNQLKINNFIDLLIRIENTEKNRSSFNLNLELKDKFEIFTQNYEILFFSDIDFDDEFKIEMLNIYNQFLYYRNSLYIFNIFAVPQNLINDEGLTDITSKIRNNEAVKWIQNIQKFDEFIKKLKEYI